MPSRLGGIFLASTTVACQVIDLLMELAMKPCLLGVFAQFCHLKVKVKLTHHGRLVVGGDVSYVVPSGNHLQIPKVTKSAVNGA